MRIGVIGTHCSGKTSLIHRMYRDVRFAQYEFFDEPIRTVGRVGFHVNKDSDDAAQLAMLAIHLRNINENNFISDRTLLDLYVYGLTLKNISQDVLDFIHSMWVKHADDYDYLFWCQPEFPLVSDGFRVVDKEWQEQIHDLFNEQISEILLTNRLKHCKIISITGQTEDRYNKVVKEVFGE